MTTLTRIIGFFAILAFWTWLAVITNSWFLIGLEMLGCVASETLLFEIWEVPTMPDDYEDVNLP